MGSSPFRRTKTSRWLLTGYRGVFFFVSCARQSIGHDRRFQPRCAERELGARQAGIAQDELILVQSLHRRLLLDRHGIDALLQHPPDERVRALDSIKGRDQIHARGAAADMHPGPKLRTQAFRQLIAGVAYHEKIRRFQWAAIGIEPVGVVVLTVMSGGLSQSGGLMWLFLAALSLSTYNILQRKLTQKYSAMQASTYSIFFGTILLAIFSPAAFRELAAAPAV